MTDTDAGFWLFVYFNVFHIWSKRFYWAGDLLRKGSEQKRKVAWAGSTNEKYEKRNRQITTQITHTFSWTHSSVHSSLADGDPQGRRGCKTSPFSLSTYTALCTVCLSDGGSLSRCGCHWLPRKARLNGNTVGLMTGVRWQSPLSVSALLLLPFYTANSQLPGELLLP